MGRLGAAAPADADAADAPRGQPAMTYKRLGPPVEVIADSPYTRPVPCPW